MNTQVSQKKENRSISASQAIWDSVDRMALKVKDETGAHCDRSKIVAALCELLISAESHFAPEALATTGSNELIREAALLAIIKRFGSGAPKC